MEVLRRQRDECDESVRPRLGHEFVVNTKRGGDSDLSKWECPVREQQ